MLIMSLATYYVITLDDPNIITYLLIILLSPPPLTCRFELGLITHSVRPYKIRHLLNIVEDFFSNIPNNKKVLAAYHSPQGVYENVFHGYRQPNELLCYAANTREFLFFPDYWFVFKYNYTNAPECWGKSLTDIEGNLKRWGADYVFYPVLDEFDKNELQSLLKNDFKIISELNWNIEKNLKFEEIFYLKSPHWYILQKLQ